MQKNSFKFISTNIKSRLSKIKFYLRAMSKLRDKFGLVIVLGIRSSKFQISAWKQVTLKDISSDWTLNSTKFFLHTQLRQAVLKQTHFTQGWTFSFIWLKRKSLKWREKTSQLDPLFRANILFLDVEVSKNMWMCTRIATCIEWKKKRNFPDIMSFNAF
jgi:hypothetical protein